MSLLPFLFCIIAAGVAGFSNRKSTDHIVCETNACRTIGESIQRSINKSVDPCINFYEYGCGLWPENNPIPSNEVIWSTMAQIGLKTHLRLKEILEESNEYDNLEPVQKMKQYYDSCIDEDAIEKQGLEPIQEILDANGGWPIQFGNQKINNYTWQEIDTNYMQDLFEGTFLEFGFIPEEKDTTKTILVLAQFKKSFVDAENIVRSKSILFPWEQHKMTNVVGAFMKQKGIDTPPENFTADVTELLIFQQNFQNITMYENEIHKGMKKNQDRMTVAELQKYYDEAGTRNPTAQIDWLNLIQKLLKPFNITVNSSYPVLVYNKQLFHKLAHLLDDTPPHVIVNYVQWNIVNKFLPFLNKEMRDYLFETLQMKYNVTEREPRWITCVKDIPMKDALSFLFVKKYHSSHTIAAVTEMLNDLKAEIKEYILNSKWTNNNMKNFMTDKVDNIISLIGYPSWYNNETAMIKRYEGLEIGENYFENKIVSLTYEIRKTVITSLDSTDRSKWHSSPLTMNAFYDATRNLMIIPVAEIQDPFFTPGMPLAVNYGAISMIIGHELAHSFDTIGIEYDKFGNKITKDAETAQAYEEQVKCFIDQYNNYTVIAAGKGRTPVHLNGLFTKDENVADNIGLQIAFAAFQKRKQLAGPQPKLPGLTDISDEQLFFLSFANIWCTTMTEQIATILTNYDSHSLNKFRVLGVVSNMVSFSDTFNCPAGSPLNRDSKCTLWK